jgi:hypothetical protein
MTNLQTRQILESLRTGVPIREAVQLVGSGQPGLEVRFSDLLDDVRVGKPRQNNGFIFFGDFGTGKSHALEFFSSTAVNKKFVVSRATISKNLQLSNYRAVLSQLMSQMSTTEHKEEALARILDDSNSKGVDYSDLVRWCQTEVEAGRLSSIYREIASKLHMLRYGTEEFDKLMSYFAGSASQVEIKKAIGAPRAEVPTAESRSLQTLQFLSRLFVHLGYNGWVLLFDELELIRVIGSQAARVARGKSYAALTDWFGLSNKTLGRSIATIGCMTTSFVADIVDDQGQNSWNDYGLVPAALAVSKSSDLVNSATSAMNFLRDQESDSSLQLQWPDRSAKVNLQVSIKKLYDEAYGTSSPELELVGEEYESIRIFIRRWIANWDLARHGRSDSVSILAIKQNFDVDEEDDGVSDD